MSDSKKPPKYEAPKGAPPPYTDADGDVTPLEHFDNDQPFGEVETGPGSLCDQFAKEVDKSKKK